MTLVFQQAAVLRNNLDQNVAHIFGAIGPDLWDQATWTDQLTKNMVIVCTAEILDQALLNAFVKMGQINLLIFDEAHHTKKGHPYARSVFRDPMISSKCESLCNNSIIRNAYLKADSSERPRIFGMTASPIDAKVDITEAARSVLHLILAKFAQIGDSAANTEKASGTASR